MSGLRPAPGDLLLVRCVISEKVCEHGLPSSLVCMMKTCLFGIFMDVRYAGCIQTLIQGWLLMALHGVDVMCCWLGCLLIYWIRL